VIALARATNRRHTPVVRWLGLLLLAGCDVIFVLKDPIETAPDGGDQAFPDGPDILPPCPGYEPRSGLPHTYRALTTSRMWQQPQDICAQDGAHLATPTKTDQLIAIRVESGLAGNIFVGIGRPPLAPTFRTLTGVPIELGPAMWNVNQPDGDPMSLQVAEITSSGEMLLNDVAPFFMNEALCECSGQPITPF
jgi:hypothetical protein